MKMYEDHKQFATDQSSHYFTVEKMSATSTTSPVTENTNEDREIQNALDKKRKKRIQHNNNNRDSKHPRVEGCGGSSIHQRYFEAAREQETTQRISQDLPNCNWLEQKIKLSENKKCFSSNTSKSISGSDSDEDNLVVDDDDDVFEENIKEKPRVPEVINSVPSTSSFPKQYDGGEVNMKEVNTVTIDDQEEPEVVFSPPCITIAEQEGAQPLQIQVSIAGEKDQFSFDDLPMQHELKEPNFVNESMSKRTLIPYQEQPRLIQDSDGMRKTDHKDVQEWFKEQTGPNEVGQKESKIASLRALKEEIEKDIESLKNKKIKEMEELIEIKTTKEKFMNELESLRLDMFKEKNLLDSIKQHHYSDGKRWQQVSENQHDVRLDNGDFSKTNKNLQYQSNYLHPMLEKIQSIKMNKLKNNNERVKRYSVEDIQNPSSALSPSRPLLEQQHKEILEYKQKLLERNALISSNTFPNMSRDYNRSMNLINQEEMYKHMMEKDVRRSWLKDDRPREPEHPSNIPPLGYPSPALKPVPMLPYGEDLVAKRRVSNNQPYPHYLDTSLSHAPPRGPYLDLPHPRPPPDSSSDMTVAKCEACAAPALFMCSACKGAHYCSTECQRGHWLSHNMSCKQTLRR